MEPTPTISFPDGRPDRRFTSLTGCNECGLSGCNHATSRSAPNAYIGPLRPSSMTCPSCKQENRPGAKFCEECAAPLQVVCGSCGATLRSAAKFCDSCGTPVAGSPPANGREESAGARKIVTIVFADLVGSTALHERLDPESARRFMESYYAATQAAVERHGGIVTQLLGDGVKAVFGVPRVAEDDAIRAVRAAVAMQDAFRSLAEQQRDAVGETGLRVAVNTGEVVAIDETEIIGDPVNVAARLQEQGRGRRRRRSESRLTGSFPTLRFRWNCSASFTLKGRSEAVKAYRVVSLERPVRHGGCTAAFVGRDRGTRATSLPCMRTAVAEAGKRSLAVLLGSPGLGKSRLDRRVLARRSRRSGDGRPTRTANRRRRLHVLAARRSRCANFSGSKTGATLRRVARDDRSRTRLPDRDHADQARVASGIAALLAGVHRPRPEETFFVLRRMLERAGGKVRQTGRAGSRRSPLGRAAAARPGRTPDPMGRAACRC